LKHKSPPLFLLSGMGADERLFAAQAAAIPQLRVPPWLMPRPDETLAGYAARFADGLRPAGPCFIGGASFGGCVALEMARHLDVLGCFLIGSVRSPAEFPRAFQALRKVSRATKAVPYELASLLSKAALLSSRGTLTQPAAVLLEQLSATDAAFLRWACRTVLEWNPPAAPPAVPIFQIHGAEDPVLPVKYTHPDMIVPGAGHALSLTHPQAVTDFLVRHMADLLAQRSACSG